MDGFLTEKDFRESGDKIIEGPRRSRCVVESIDPDGNIEVARLTGGSRSISFEFNIKLLSASIRKNLRIGSVIVWITWVREVGEIVKDESFYLLEEEDISE